MKTVTLKNDLIHAGNLILVNKQHPYHENIVEQALLPVNSAANTVLLEENAVRFLSAVMGKLGAWKQIAAVSGWRSAQGQKEIYMESIQDKGCSFTKKYVALPGCSEHQTGLAIDLGLQQEKIDFICPDFPYEGICDAFRKAAPRYGFIERYLLGKEGVTGIAHEPWHFRYVGTPHAEIMKMYNFTLEEYILFLKNYPFGKMNYCYDGIDSHVMVSYLHADQAPYTRFEIDNSIPYSVSGNNIDGYIVTEWRKKNE